MNQTVPEILAALTAAIKETVREEVRAELIAELGGARPQQKSKSSKKPGPKPKAAASALPGVTPGARRGEDEIEVVKKAIVRHLKANPGTRVDQMAAVFELPVKDLQLPIQQLLKGKEISKKGRLRGTTYQVRG